MPLYNTNKPTAVKTEDPEHSTIRRVASGRYSGIPLPEHKNPMRLQKAIPMMNKKMQRKMKNY